MNKGADSARGDDAAGLKTAVVGWLRCGSQVPEPALESHQKAGHSFYHDATTRLICPVDYEWSNPWYAFTVPALIELVVTLMGSILQP